MTCLSSFHLIRPPFETSQENTFEWIEESHVASEKTSGSSPEELLAFRNALKEKLYRVGAKSDRISKRGHILKDFLHRNWDEMEVYSLLKSPTGNGLSVRMSHFDAFVEKVFEDYYPAESLPPDDLIHVTCTGYLSPSGAQKIVSKRNWGHRTTVTHAYHMGCYGALPAIRIGSGFLHAGKQTVDIVHTEICCIHSNPSSHRADQLVTQTLFADGFIKYTLSSSSSDPHLKCLAIHEQIITGSIDAMTWNIADWGNEISLAKEIPVLISRAILNYLETLCKKANLPLSVIQKGMFAIHPGGPKILQQLQERLSLSDRQISYSFKILKEYGNMSSATLPHVWDAILNDPEISAGSYIISLAFGPGLTIAGCILEKSCGS